jgi:hypothetical protein
VRNTASRRGLHLAPTIVLALLIGAAGCGGPEPIPQAPTQEKAVARPKKKQAMQVLGQLGSLDEGKVNDTFQRLLPQLGDCMGKGAGKIEFLAGHVKVLVRIAMDGSAHWAYLSESTIGDRDTEKCILSAVKRTTWPPPVEGEGQAEKAFDFDPSPDVRDAVAWEPDHVQKQLQSAHGKLAHCIGGARGPYRVTAYIDRDGSVMGAGVAVPDERGESAADCIADATKAVKFPSPGSWPAKVTFELR